MNNIVFASDKRYIVSTCVAINSLIKNTNNTNISLICYKIDKGTKNIVSKIYKDSINFIDCDNYIPIDLPVTEDLSEAVYCRFFFEDLIECDKFLYLDSDVLVKKDISSIFDISLNSEIVAASICFSNPTVSHQKGVSKWMELGMDRNTPLFNTGVMLVDLDNWVDNNTKQKSLDYISKYRRYINIADQDAINAAISGNFKTLAPAWNQETELRKEYMSSNNCLDESQKNAAMDPYIVHFNGIKQWRCDPNIPELIDWDYEFKEVVEKIRLIKKNI